MADAGAKTTASRSRVVAEDAQSVGDRAATALQRLSGQGVVVAGAAGFLASHLVDALAHANEALLDKPCRIICLDNFVTGAPTRLAHLDGRPDVVFHRSDVSQGVELDEPVDFVVHAASIASPTWYRRFPLETIDVNVSGTRHLLELALARRASSFLYLSSSEIYGDPPPDRIPTREEYWGHVSSTGPRAPYDESKRLAETLCTTYYRLHELPVVIARPFNVYGPRLSLDDGRVIPDFAGDVLAGRPIVVRSDGRVTRSFCYIADFVAAALLLLAHGTPGEAYNVGNDDEVTIGELAETFAQLGGGLEVRYETSDDPLYLVDNPSRRSPDLTKTQAAIEWKPAVPLRVGLERTLSYYREGGAG